MCTTKVYFFPSDNFFILVSHSLKVLKMHCQLHIFFPCIGHPDLCYMFYIWEKYYRIFWSIKFKRKRRKKLKCYFHIMKCIAVKVALNTDLNFLSRRWINGAFSFSFIHKTQHKIVFFFSRIPPFLLFFILFF